MKGLSGLRAQLAAAVCIVCSTVFSQVNIVQNSGFETTTGCPSASAQWNLCPGWNNVNMQLGVGPYGSPDFYHTCGTNNTAPPSTYAGYCPTHNGNGMMSMVIYNMGYADYREYLSTQLLCPMLPGITYTLSFWLSNGQTHSSPWTIKNIGAYFSASPLSQSGWGVINVSPQFEITSNVVSSGWTQYTFTVNPTTTWNYLTIGAFRADSQNNVTLSWPNPGGPPSAYANYFIDDIEVFRPTSSVAVSASSPTVCLGAAVTLSASGATSYTWSTGAFGSQVTVVPNMSTIYSVTGAVTNTCSGSGTASVVVQVLPSVSLSVTTTASKICPGQAVTLSAFGASNYTWASNSSQTITPSFVIVTPLSTTIYSVQGLTALGCKAQSTMTVSVVECLGIDDGINEGNIKVLTIFSDRLILSGGNGLAQIILVNALGELVLKEEVQLQSSGQMEVPVLNVGTGIYTLYLQHNGKQTVRKLLRE